MSVKSSVTVPLGGSDMSLHYRAARGTRQVEASDFGRRLQLDLGRFAPPQLAASLGLCVDLGAEEQRDRAQPEPGQHHDDRRKSPPGRVEGPELAHVEAE